MERPSTRCATGLPRAIASPTRAASSFSARAAICSSACCCRRSTRCASTARCRPILRSSASRARNTATTQFRDVLPGAARRRSCRPSQKPQGSHVGRLCARGSATSRPTSTTRSTSSTSKTDWRKTTRSSGPPAITCSISRRRRRSFRRSSSSSRRQGSTQDAEGWTRIVVEKPFGTDLQSARKLQRAIEAVFPENADLPHRPLPRQRAGARHHRAALRKHDLRADLEPQLRAERADHGGRVDRRRRARRLLRSRRRAARHDPKPRHQLARAGRDGAADQFGCRRHSQRKV